MLDLKVLFESLMSNMLMFYSKHITNDIKKGVSPSWKHLQNFKFTDFTKTHTKSRKYFAHTYDICQAPI